MIYSDKALHNLKRNMVMELQESSLTREELADLGVSNTALDTVRHGIPGQTRLLLKLADVLGVDARLIWLDPEEYDARRNHPKD